MFLYEALLLCYMIDRCCVMYKSYQNHIQSDIMYNRWSCFIKFPQIIDFFQIHKFLLVPEADSGNAIAVVVVSSVAFICLVLLAGLLVRAFHSFIFKRKNRENKYLENRDIYRIVNFRRIHWLTFPSNWRDDPIIFCKRRILHTSDLHVT